MTRHLVKSTSVKSLGYAPDTKKLHVEFHSGGVYEYEDVEPHEYLNLRGAGSIGKHFHEHFRKPGKQGKKL